MSVEECLNAAYDIQSAIEKMRASSNPHRRVILSDINRQLEVVTGMLCRLLNADHDAREPGDSK